MADRFETPTHGMIVRAAVWHTTSPEELKAERPTPRQAPVIVRRSGERCMRYELPEWVELQRPSGR
mgnify:CR=1 FL=1